MPLNLSRNGIKFVLASIAVNAVIGIVAIVSGEFSELDAKILVTSLSVTGGAVLALANLAARSGQFIKYVPEAGAVFAVIGFSLLVYNTWDEFAGENIARAMGTAILFGAGTAHAGLLSRGRLVPRYRHVLTAAWLLAAVLVVMITILIWASDAVEDDAYARVMGVVIVLLAAVTLAVPVLHRASRDELADETRSRTQIEAAVRYCPSCGDNHLQLEDDQAECKNCGAQFTVGFQL